MILLFKRFLSNKFINVGILLTVYIFVLILYFFKDITLYTIGGDIINFYFPHYHFFLKSLEQGVVPFWFPYSFLGLPELFKLELSYFYPGTWIILIINLLFNQGLNLNFLGKTIQLSQYAHLLLAAVGMFFLLRKAIRLSFISSLIGGLLYGFTFYMTSQIGDISSFYAKVYLPFIILALIKFLKNKTFFYYFLLLSLNTLIFTFGYPYNYIYIFISEILLASLYNFKKALIIGIIIINSVLLGGIILLPNLHIISQSSRFNSVDVNPNYHKSFAFVPYKIVNIINPELTISLSNLNNPGSLFYYGNLTWGSSLLIFLILGFSFLRSGVINSWLLIVFIFGILYGFGGYFGIPNLLGNFITFFEKLRSHTSILVLVFLSGTIIVSQGIEAVLVGKKNKLIESRIWLLLGFSVIFLIFLIFSRTITFSEELIIAISKTISLIFFSLLFLRLFWRTKRKIFIYLIIVISIFESIYYYNQIGLLHYKSSYEKFYEKNSLVPEFSSNNNMFRYSFNNDQFNYNTEPVNVFNLQGYETVPYAAYYNIVNEGEERYLRFSNIKYLVTTEEGKDKNNNYLRLIKDINPAALNEHIVSSSPDLPFWSNTSTNHHYIYEIKEYLPRFFVPSQIINCKKNDCSLKGQPADTIFVNNFQEDFKNPKAKDVNINILEYKPNNIKLSITTNKKAFIASSEVFDKGWSLEINGRPENIYNINGGFRGFVVPGGKSIIKLSYMPPNILLGSILTLFGVILIFLNYLVLKNNNRFKWLKFFNDS